MRNILIPLGAGIVVVACSGTAVVDGGSGGGTTSNGNNTSGNTTSGNTTSGTTSGTTSTGPADCTALTMALTDALSEAMRCDSCSDGPDPCEYLSGQQLTDACGCPVPVNSTSPDAVSKAVSIYQDWLNAMCGPLECGQPCGISNDPRCTGGSGTCEGVCSP